jgi:hypothetical protein
MRRIVGLIVFGLLAGLSPFRADAKIDDRWSLKAGEGSPEATYMDARKKNVVFTASCTPATHLFTLRYAGEVGTPLKADDPPLSIAVGDQAVPLATEFTGGQQVGTVTIDRKTAALFAGTGGIEINAANEMGVSWYVGQAAPLRQVVKACAPSPSVNGGGS